MLRAMARTHGRCTFRPADVSRAALRVAAARIREQERDLVEVHPIVATHEVALRRVKELERPLFVLFIGSSIGNYDDDDAVKLLRAVRDAMGRSGVFLLATDLRKSVEILLPAYDDAQGVTAAFNKNVLARINRELGGRFDLDRFRHVAVWNEAASAVEMHLESLVDQTVPIELLGMRVYFREGERIHTESSHKYDRERVEALLARGGFRRARTFEDERAWFGVHLCVPI
jgi:dimethylhistidine N-methyltransferase